MKKLVSAALSLILILSLTTCGFAAAKQPASVVIEADKNFTNPVMISSQTVVSELYSYISTSKRVLLKAPQVTELAKLVFSTSVSGDQVEDVPYTVYKAADNSLYTMKNNKIYKLSINADRFYTIADESDIGFYKYRTIPTAKCYGASDLPMKSSNYKFKKLDGLFYTTKFVSPDEMRGEIGETTIHVPKFSVEPESVKVSVTYNKDEKVIWSGDLSKVKEFKPELSGTYIVKYTALYESPYYSGEVVYEYEPHYTVPSKEISFSVEGAASAPGEVVILIAENIPENGNVTVKSDIKYTPYFFRQDNGDMVALLPVSYHTAPGNYALELGCGDAAQKFTIQVAPKSFSEQYLTVPAETTEATINSKKANDEFEKYIAPIRYVTDDKQYWSGRFIWPLKQLPRRTTEFGAIRYVNGDTKNPSRHGAIDFAAAAGTPVYAPAAGRVLYSGNLQLTGHTICIEHGYGLKTWYYHMNGRNVKTNDIVKQGQQIGIVGSTGFSTGAHLHYGMSVSNTVSGNVWVNPDTSVVTDRFYALPSEGEIGAIG